MQMHAMRDLFGVTQRPLRTRRRIETVEEVVAELEEAAAMRVGLASSIYRRPGLVGLLPIFGADSRDTTGDEGDTSRPPDTGGGGGSTAPASGDRIRNAAKVLSAVRPGLNAAASQTFLGDAKAESDFGWAFKTPDGSNSNNWGAIYAPGDRGTVPVADTNDGKAFTGGAAWWSTPELGARQFVNLIEGSYAPALERATAGDVWGYARALWRDGPGSSRPSYYGGFPPGHKWGAPAGVPLHSDLDHWYRITAYAKMVMGGAQAVAAALGQPLAVRLDIPPQPGSGSGGDIGTGKKQAIKSGSGIGAGAVIAGGAVLIAGAVLLAKVL